MPVQTRKRNGDLVPFAPDKILVAIQKAFLATKTPATPTVVAYLTERTITSLERDLAKTETPDVAPIETIQNHVEDALMDTGYKDVARAYVRYRHVRELARKQNTTDESILSLLHNTNKELAEENSNKNTRVAATQRDYIAGEVSRDLTRRLLLPKKISDAHDAGILHFHDADYFIQPIFNCFAPWTRFLTDEGERAFRDFADGDRVRVLASDGEWREATVHNYGPRPLVNVVLEDASDARPQAVVGFTCTRDHRWILEDGTVTTELKPGDVLRPADLSRLASDDETAPEATTWRVRAISPYGGVGETHDAWCVEEPVTKSFTLSPGVLTGNCCLINIGDMLDNGTVMNGKMIESPHSFRVASTIMTQIIACVASNQYGGQSVDLSHLGKYLRLSREKFEKKVAEDCPSATDAERRNLAARLLKDELAAGVQTIQYQINTLMTTNGQHVIMCNT